MERNVLTTDLTGKVAVVTGAGGVLCGYLSKVLARAGAKVALVNRSDGAINQYAAEIVAEGGIAKAYKGNVLSKEDMERIAAQVLASFSFTWPQIVTLIMSALVAGFTVGVPAVSAGAVVSAAAEVSTTVV